MKINFTMNNLFKDYILNSRAKVIINYGGRDSGKSFFTGGQYVPYRMITDKYFRGIAIRKSYSLLKDSCFQEVIDGVEFAGAFEIFKDKKAPLEILCKKNGNKLIFKGLDDGRKLKSLKGISFIWVEEAEELTEREFWDLLILLRAGDNPTLILTFNPIDEDHFSNALFVESVADRVLKRFYDGDKKVWIKNIVQEIEGQQEIIECLVLRSTYEDNAFIPATRKAIIESLQDTDPFLYDVYRKGLYGSRKGKILNNTEVLDFDKEGIVFNNYDNKGYSQDFGFNHANCILAVAEKDNNLYIFDELYGTDRDTEEWIAEANKRGLNKRLRMICDSAEPDRIKTWKKAGYKAEGVKKFSGSVGVQIDRLMRYDKIYINSKCVNTIKEAKHWRWREDRMGNLMDEPVTVFDDAMASLRYATQLFYEHQPTLYKGITQKRRRKVVN